MNALPEYPLAMETEMGWKESVRIALSKAQNRGYKAASIARATGIAPNRLSTFLSKGQLGTDGVRKVELHLIDLGLLQPVMVREGFTVKRGSDCKSVTSAFSVVTQRFDQTPKTLAFLRKIHRSGTHSGTPTNPLTYTLIIGYIYLVAGRRPPEPVGHRTGDDDDV